MSTKQWYNVWCCRKILTELHGKLFISEKLNGICCELLSFLDMLLPTQKQNLKMWKAMALCTRKAAPEQQDLHRGFGERYQ